MLKIFEPFQQIVCSRFGSRNRPTIFSQLTKRQLVQGVEVQYSEVNSMIYSNYHMNTNTI